MIATILTVTVVSTKATHSDFGLKQLAELERAAFVVAHPLLPSNIRSTRKALLSNPNKHVFVFVGEPRVGKTTLALFSCISPSSLHIDTDGFSEIDCSTKLTKTLQRFYKESHHVVCIITIGRHRHRKAQIIGLIDAFSVQTGIIVSLCRVSRRSQGDARFMLVR